MCGDVEEMEWKKTSDAARTGYKQILLFDSPKDVSAMHFAETPQYLKEEKKERYQGNAYVQRNESGI